MSWTRDTVRLRIREAWYTLRRVPAHGVPGFRTSWPDFVQDYYEAYGHTSATVRLARAAPQAIDRMNECFSWFRYLEDGPHLTKSAQSTFSSRRTKEFTRAQEGREFKVLCCASMMLCPGSISSFGRATVQLPFVRDVQAHQLDFEAPIFHSLKGDYAEFDTWVRKCRKEQRRAWTIERHGQYAAVTILKEESPSDAGFDIGARKILKLGLFKVSEMHAGLRLGELLLKKALRFATKNGFEAIYLTSFLKHAGLIELCESAGFSVVGKKGDELIVAKKLTGDPPSEASLDEVQRFLFPRFRDDAKVRKIVVPIEAGYHQRLFPEASPRRELDLLDMIQSDADERAVPGNTFRKVYVTRSRMRQIGPGDLLLFYVNKNKDLAASQAVTYVGVVESVVDAASIEDLVRVTSKRTAYLKSELEKLMAEPGLPRVIEFMAIGPLDPPLGLADAQRLGVLLGPPQSLMLLSEKAYASLKGHSQVRF